MKAGVSVNNGNDRVEERVSERRKKSGESADMLRRMFTDAMCRGRYWAMSSLDEKQNILNNLLMHSNTSIFSFSANVFSKFFSSIFYVIYYPEAKYAFSSKPFGSNMTQRSLPYDHKVL